MSGGGEIVFLPVFGAAVVVGVGVVVVGGTAAAVVGTGVSIITDSALEAADILSGITAAAVTHLANQYEIAVADRERNSRAALQMRALGIIAERGAAADAAAAIQRTQTHLSGSATVDLLSSKLQEIRVLVATLRDASLSEELACIEADATKGDSVALVARIVVLERRVVAALEAVAPEIAGGRDPEMRRAQYLRRMLERSIESIRLSLDSPFVPEDRRDGYTVRVDELLRETDAVGLESTVRTLRALDDGIRKEATASMVGEVKLRRAWARAGSAVEALCAAVPDARSLVLVADLQRRLTALAQASPSAGQVEAFASEADAARVAVLKRWQGLQLAVESAKLVAGALGNQGYDVGFVSPRVQGGEQPPLVVKVDDQYGVRFTFESDESGAVVSRTQMVAFDPAYAVVDDASQRHVCEFIKEFAARIGAVGFEPRWIEAGETLDVVESPSVETNNAVRGGVHTLRQIEPPN